MAQRGPMRHVVIIHCIPPAEYPVFGKKRKQHSNQHIGARQFGEGHQKTEKLFQRHITGLR